MLFGLLALVGCSRQVVAPIEVPVYVHDTVVQHNIIKDSVFVDEWNYVVNVGDTVYCETVKNVYHEKLVFDTVYASVEVPVEVVKTVAVEKKLSTTQRALITVGAVAVMALLAIVAYKICKVWRRG